MSLPALTESETYTRIGGWLLLPALVLLIQPIWLLYEMYKIFIEDISQVISMMENFEAILYISMLLLISLPILIFMFFTMDRFFKRKKITPKLMYVVYLAPVIIALGFCILDSGDPSNLKELRRAVIPLLIWGPYFYKSKRVKNTFVN